jgi:hypothetical protein
MNTPVIGRKQSEIADLVNYHVVINTGLTGYEGAAPIIGDAALAMHVGKASRFAPV